MYTEFYNFSAEPFRVTPDPGFLFLTDQHKEALAAIIYGIARRKGFVCITGEVGVGKTTILKSYLDSVDEPGLRFVYVYNPNVSFQALLRHIFKEIGLAHEGDDVAAMVEALQHWLVAAHRRRETLVLMIDEAQNMPIGTLENLRMLSNLETATEKLVQVVLVGQPELEAQLATHQLRQVESRIAVRTRLGPLSAADSAAYIRHRLRCVSLDDRPAFTDAAIALIARAARGIPRRINVICDNCLMTGFGHKARPVGAAIVREVLHDLRLKDRTPATPAWLPSGLSGALAEMMPPRLPEWRMALPPRTVLMAGGGVAAALAVLVAGFALSGLALSGPEPPATPKPTPVAAQRLPVAAVPMPSPVAVPMPAPARPPALAAEAPMTVNLDPGAGPGEGARRRVVLPGDTLTRLTSEAYGRADGGSLDWVKRHNPSITDIDRLMVGQVIEFPPLPSR